MDVGFDASGIDIAVLTHGGGIIGQFAGRIHTAVSEFVLAARIYKLGAERCVDTVGQAQFHKRRRVEKVERTGAQRGPRMVDLTLLKVRGACTDIDGTGRTEILGRLQNLTFLAVIERDGLDVVERELAEVNLSVLGVSKFYPVVDHSCVVRSHRTDIDRLDSAHTSVVLHLHARKIAQCIGYAVAVKALKLFAVKFLRRNHLYLRSLGCDHHLAQHMVTLADSCGITPSRRI